MVWVQPPTPVGRQRDREKLHTPQTARLGQANWRVRRAHWTIAPPEGGISGPPDLDPFTRRRARVCRGILQGFPDTVRGDQCRAGSMCSVSRRSVSDGSTTGAAVAPTAQDGAIRPRPSAGRRTWCLTHPQNRKPRQPAPLAKPSAPGSSLGGAGVPHFAGPVAVAACGYGVNNGPCREGSDAAHQATVASQVAG